MLQIHEEKLEHIRTLLQGLGNDTKLAMHHLQSGLNDLDVEQFNKAKLLLKNSDSKGNEVDNEVVSSLALFGAEATDLRELVAFLKATNEFIRISDHIKSFSKRISPLLEESNFENSKEYASHLCKSATNAVEFALKALKTNNKDETKDLFRQVQVEESKTDDLYSILEKNIISKLAKMDTFSEEQIQILSIMRKLERVADRSVNIAKLALFAKAGGELNIY